MDNHVRMTILLVFLIAGTIFLPGPAGAGGIALYEIGIRETGTAAAGWASRADDASTLFTNPAGMTRLDKSELLFGGQGLYTGLRFSPDSRTTTTGTRGDTSQWLPSGNLYYVHSLSKDWKVGVGVLGYFGLSLDYGDNWVGRYYIQSATLQGMTIQPSVAYRVTEQLSLGAGLNMMNGTLENKVALNNINPRMLDGQLKISDNTWGFGANLGVLYELNKKTRFGLNYLSEVKLDFKDTPQFNGVGPALFTVLRNRGLLNSTIDLTMWVPQMAMFSFFHEFNDRWAVMGNVGWQQWSRFGKVDVSVSSVNQPSLTTDLSYRDTWHFALGGQYRISKPWLLFFGAAYDSSAVKGADMTASVPMGETYRFGMGSEYHWSEHLSFGFAYELVWIGTLNLYQSRGPLAGTVAGEFGNSYIHAVQGAVRYRF